MRPVAIACPKCSTRLESQFEPVGQVAGQPGNEFAVLSGEDLHLLRIFVHCEGSIREMEAALGVSYPTVKARVAALRQKLDGARGGPPISSPPPVPPVPVDEVGPGPMSVEQRVAGILDDMKSGRLSPVQAAEQIRAARGL